MPSEQQSTSSSEASQSKTLTVEEFIREAWEQEIQRTHSHATRRIDEFRAEAELVRKQLSEIR
mgnify:FL=1